MKLDLDRRIFFHYPEDRFDVCGGSTHFSGPAPHIDVKASCNGAIGDGTTDDTAAIQRAITAAATAGGGIVYFPPGTYLISATLTVPNGITLTSGHRSPISTTVAQTRPLITTATALNPMVSLGHYSSIEGLWIDGEAVAVNGVAAIDVVRPRIEGCLIRDCTTAAVKMGDVIFPTMRNNYCGKSCQYGLDALDAYGSGGYYGINVGVSEMNEWQGSVSAMRLEGQLTSISDDFEAATPPSGSGAVHIGGTVNSRLTMISPYFELPGNSTAIYVDNSGHLQITGGEAYGAVSSTNVFIECYAAYTISVQGLRAARWQKVFNGLLTSASNVNIEGCYFTDYTTIWAVTTLPTAIQTFNLTTANSTYIGSPLRLPVRTAAPSTPAQGMFAIADRATWDPATKGSGGAYPVWYNGTAWTQLEQETAISVKSYGATGDGTTDDSAAINAAIAAQVGARIYFPPGTYRIASPLNCTISAHEGVTLEGSNHGTYGTVIKCDTGEKPAIDFTGNTKCIIRNLKLIPGTTSPSTVGMMFIRNAALDQSGYHTLDDVVVYFDNTEAANGGLGTVGIYNVCSEVFVLRNCLIRGDTGLWCDRTNTLAKTSDYQTCQTSIQNSSISVIRLEGGYCIGMAGPAIYLANGADFKSSAGLSRHAAVTPYQYALKSVAWIGFEWFGTIDTYPSALALDGWLKGARIGPYFTPVSGYPIIEGLTAGSGINQSYVMVTPTAAGEAVATDLFYVNAATGHGALWNNHFLVRGSATTFNFSHASSTIKSCVIQSDKLLSDWTINCLAAQKQNVQLVCTDGTQFIGGLPVLTTKTPASAAATGTTGQFAWDASYVYVCTATDTWKRAAIATW